MEWHPRQRAQTIPCPLHSLLREGPLGDTAVVGGEAPQLHPPTLLSRSAAVSVLKRLPPLQLLCGALLHHYASICFAPSFLLHSLASLLRMGSKKGVTNLLPPFLLAPPLPLPPPPCTSQPPSLRTQQQPALELRSPVLLAALFLLAVLYSPRMSKHLLGQGGGW